MSNIQQNLQKILQAVWGKDVRQAIHDAIHDCYEDGSSGSIDLIAREDIEELEATKATRVELAEETADRLAEVAVERGRIDNLVTSGTGVTNATKRTETTLFTSTTPCLGNVSGDLGYFNLSDDIDDYDYIKIRYNAFGKTGIVECKPSDIGASGTLGQGVFHWSEIQPNTDVSIDNPKTVFRHMDFYAYNISSGNTHRLSIDAVVWGWNGDASSNGKVSDSFTKSWDSTKSLYVTSGFTGGIYSITGIKYADAGVDKDTELTDIRTGADGTVYLTAGGAVRGQVDDINDRIDGIESNFGEEYDPEDTYSVGDRRVHDGAWYECNTEINTPEAWTAGHWDHISLVDIVDQVNTNTADIATNASAVNQLKEDLNAVIDFNPIILFGETVSGTQSAYKYPVISAGTYDLHVDSVTSDDIDNTSSYVVFYNGSTAVLTKAFARGVEINESVTFSADVNKIFFLASGSFPASYGDNFSYTNFQIKKQVILYDEINKKLEKVGAGDVDVDAITQENLSFAEPHIPTNLFDYTSDDMSKTGWWYYSTTIGAVMAPVKNANTGGYTALTIPVYDADKVTIGTYGDLYTNKIYWIGAVDKDMKLLSYQTVNQNMPVTYTMPEKAVYLIASLVGYTDALLQKIIVENGDAITADSAYFKPYYFLNGCRSDAEKPEEIEVMQSIIGTGENTVKLCLPDAYDLVVGDTFELFYKGIINAVNPDMYDIVINCSKGSAYSKRFIITPTTAENLTMTVTLYGINHNVLDTKAVTLRIHNKASSPSTIKNVLCVGDSLTTSGQWPAELYRRLTASNGSPEGDGLTNINFIGTRATASGVHYEGYGGWTLNSYNTENVSFNVRVITCTHDKNEAEDQHSIYKDANNVQWKLETIETGQIKIIAVTGEGRDFANTGTLTWVSGGVNHSDIVYNSQTMAAGNPFWNSATEEVDFDSYASNLGVSGIDFVYVLIGWNSASWTEEVYKESAQTFIDNVHASYPNAKIVFIGLEIPARDGLGANYGATGIYSRYYDLMQFVFNLDHWYEDIADENTNVYHVNLAGQFDTEHNMNTSTRQVNVRNTETEVYQSNGVHPAYSGTMQIADAAYRDITARL